MPSNQYTRTGGEWVDKGKARIAIGKDRKRTKREVNARLAQMRARALENRTVTEVCGELTGSMVPFRVGHENEEGARLWLRRGDPAGLRHVPVDLGVEDWVKIWRLVSWPLQHKTIIEWIRQNYYGSLHEDMFVLYKQASRLYKQYMARRSSPFPKGGGWDWTGVQ